MNYESFKPIMDKQDIQNLSESEETVWINPYVGDFMKADTVIIVSEAQVQEAENCIERAIPLIQLQYPQIRNFNDLFDSSFKLLPDNNEEFENTHGIPIPGAVLLETESPPTVFSSIKFCGGMYVVLKYAEELALKSKLLKKSDDYCHLASPKCRELFQKHTIQIDSSDHLGISVGIMSSAFGFQTIVHMSESDEEWKKELLKRNGVQIIEYAADYLGNVLKAKNVAGTKSKDFFIDKENSLNLSLGYAVAAKQLKQKLEDMNLAVDDGKPLIVYVPSDV